MKTYTWKGPQTSIEVWDDTSKTVLFEGQVATGEKIAVELNPKSEQVKGWLAFNLIEEIKAEETKGVTLAEAAADELKKRGKREGDQ